MQTTRRSLLLAGVAALAVTIVASTQVLARGSQAPTEQSMNLAAPVELSIPIEEAEAEADPTADPTAAPRAKRSGNYVPASAPRAAAPVAQAVKYTSAPGRKVAFLVGVNKAPGSTPLEGSITDVKNMKAALIMYGFKSENIHTLTDPNATRGNILNGLSSLAARSKSDGIAVFLLATHSGQSGGDLTFATGGGGRISRHELASKLGAVRGKLFTMLPTCYSAGYALPGIIGKNRIAVFSSSAGEYTWQLGSAGSWLVLYMVRYAMLDHKVPTVEGAFRWAKAAIQKEAPERAPILSDGISGELVLGQVPKPKVTTAAKKPAPKPAASTPAPTPTTKPSNGGVFCGLFGCN
jgi:hypothetical protein